MQAIMETLFDIVYDASKLVDQCPSTFILGYLPEHSLCSLGTVNNHSVSACVLDPSHTVNQICFRVRSALPRMDEFRPVPFSRISTPPAGGYPHAQ